MGVAGETADVVFTGGDDVELELLVDTVRDPTRYVITETVFLEKD